MRNDRNDVLAMIDFNVPSPQLVCVVTAGHVKLDLIVASLLTAATIHTRRAEMMSQTLVSHGMAELSGNSIFIQQQVNANIRMVIQEAEGMWKKQPQSVCQLSVDVEAWDCTWHSHVNRPLKLSGRNVVKIQPVPTNH
ncbi:hypothetical protein A1O7_07566 [Cladophialophora yegresii CBS 114405]|uniref:Uncharacterized protein n=1 Tax=Cladophialophora yegresii CBS 114405 TaxID=1182544 RepID=W9WFC1_9EURO|nr:uncharacterized protein A1O7_07566 [Cladophialophora yegresii CBS 114405]EXJ57219.1 hypothetical protein A1O7_07566 [Cladophialophora yegresii CBS 114405]